MKQDIPTELLSLTCCSNLSEEKIMEICDAISRLLIHQTFLKLKHTFSQRGYY